MSDNSQNSEKIGGTTITTSTTDMNPAVSGALKPAVKMLSPADLADVCQLIGAPPPPTTTTTTESKPPSPSSSNLYAQVLSSRRKYQLNYYFIASLYNTCIVLQLLFGAALTALGSSSTTHGNGNGLAITILAAANTVNAGVIALLHNSGLPSRVRRDWGEMAKVEAFLEEITNTGIVDVNMTKVDAVANCWNMFNAAKATIAKNEPDNYNTTTAVAATV